MKRRLLIALIGCLMAWPLGAAAGTLSQKEIVDKVVARYKVKGIFVRFHQTSTLKAMDMTDSAEGRIFIKPPGRMRWEYDSPEKQSIITDGKSVWIYRPGDDQVMIGKAEAFFGEGKGGSFLSDIGSIRKYFTITREPDDAAGDYVLKLIPDKASSALKSVVLTVSRKTFTITQAVTENGYGDKTRLTFDSPEFGKDLKDSMFTFTPPKGTQITKLSE